MAQYDLRTGTCPKCGERLEVPSHLKQFSCMFCGARLTPSDLETAEASAPLVSENEAQAAAAYYQDHILEVITNHVGIDRSLTKHAYAPAMEEYEKANLRTFRSLNTAWNGGAITLEGAAGWFLDRLEESWDTRAARKLGETRKALMETDKCVIAVFLVPMIRKLGLPCSEEYCVTLHAQWMKRHPKMPFLIGDYNEICGGFKKKFLGLCFITTAVCMEENKPDDCAELTAFRNFRDGYLRACADGPELIDAYYRLAPSIVLAIEKTTDKDARYAAIRETYLDPCYADIQAGRLQSCKARYTDMVRKLEQEYLS